MVDLPPISRVRWNKTFRIISTRYPSIDLFERVAPSEDWDALIELEMLTNSRVREELGQISNISPERRVYGNGASYVMAPFAYANESRFSDGSFGVYYAANDFKTALHEVAYHRGKFYWETDEQPLKTTEKTLLGKIDTKLHDIRKGNWKHIHDPYSYIKSQKLGLMLRNEKDSNGIVYNSVRYLGGENIAAFWPDVVSLPIESKKIVINWNGKNIDKWFDFETDEWNSIEITYSYSGFNHKTNSE
ncbi:MAG: RES family NAD+ phosphorylase [Thermodesulfobacteriota bacterium]